MDFDTRLAAALNAWIAHRADYYKQQGYTLANPHLEASHGPRWIRVHSPESGAFCFVDRDGKIYKAAGWKAPAKGARGSIYDENFSIGKGITAYGGAYRYR